MCLRTVADRKIPPTGRTFKRYIPLLKRTSWPWDQQLRTEVLGQFWREKESPVWGNIQMNVVNLSKACQRRQDQDRGFWDVGRCSQQQRLLGEQWQYGLRKEKKTVLSPFLPPCLSLSDLTNAVPWPEILGCQRKDLSAKGSPAQCPLLVLGECYKESCVLWVNS